MRCINNKMAAFLAFIFIGALFCGCSRTEQDLVAEYEISAYSGSLYEEEFYAGGLCVAQNDISAVLYTGDENVSSMALFDLSGRQVLYSRRIHERIYPASTTKIMTALLALERGNLEDDVVISSSASAAAFSYDAQVCGLVEGQVWKLQDLIGALLLHSGNDAASAIAEYIGGSEDEFVRLMNIRASQLMANNTHFVNPHGLHDDEHYTTAYDLYLIFNQCMKDERFVDIISRKSYTVSYIDTDGISKEAVFMPTNLYARGEAEIPENVAIIGGKTGTTDEAGSCLILLERDLEGQPFISIVMGAEDKSALYADMSALIQTIPAGLSSAGQDADEPEAE